MGLDCYSCQDVAFRELKNKTKEKNLTKIKNIKYDNFEMKSYLLTNEITSLKKIVFRAQTGMLPVGFNFGQKIPCFACETSDDTDRHRLEFAVLKMACPNLMENTESIFNDIFSANI